MTLISERAPAAPPALHRPGHPVRMVTAASLFDGHDAAINLMRRLLQRQGVEVIHLGHDRPVAEIVDAAISEDVQAVAVSSYQGGHLEYFGYLVERLRAAGRGDIQVYGGGGGVITPTEVVELHEMGVARIFTPDDGQRLGLAPMVNTMVAAADVDLAGQLPPSLDGLLAGDRCQLARVITALELGRAPDGWIDELNRAAAARPVPVLGITGTGGSGKSSLTDELLRRFRLDHRDDLRIAVLAVDPTRRKGGGALLGDRIRMNALDPERIYCRSLATRTARTEVPAGLADIITACRAAAYDLVIVETPGIGQGDAAIVDYVDLSLYVMTPEFGAPSQLEKIDMLDFADVVAINKFERRGAEDARRAVGRQLARNLDRPGAPPDELPVFGTVAGRFNDDGVTALYGFLHDELVGRGLRPGPGALDRVATRTSTLRAAVVPPERTRYLAEVAATVRDYHAGTAAAADAARRRQQLDDVAALVGERGGDTATLAALRAEADAELADGDRALLEGWPATVEAYTGHERTETVRGRERVVALTRESLSGTHVPPRGPAPVHRSRRAAPVAALGEPARAVPVRRRRVPAQARRRGPHPHVRRRGRRRPHQPPLPPPRRGPAGHPAVDRVRLGDAVRLRSGRAPRHLRQGGQLGRLDRHARRHEGALRRLRPVRPDHVGVDDHQRAGADDPGHVPQHGDRPAPRRLRRRARPPADRRRGRRDPGVRAANGAGHRAGRHPQGGPGPEHVHLLHRVRAGDDGRCGRVVRGQPRAQLLLGDASAATTSPRRAPTPSRSSPSRWPTRSPTSRPTGRGVWPSTTSPPTSRSSSRTAWIPSTRSSAGWPGASGRVALRDRYGAGERAQKLKYHVQTSGRSLHAQEMAFNDIRTTLQALCALYDNANSLHTNAYDEAVTTPTVESVRRAQAIQLVINREWGLSSNENPLQGSFVIEQLTDLVEEAVLAELDRLSERGGVLGAMESGYQRGRIQDESMLYEHRKHDGSLPIVGVNTFIGPPDDDVAAGIDLARSTEDEKQGQLARLRAFQEAHAGERPAALDALRDTALAGGNVFEALMAAVRCCTLGEISGALFEVGGRYRRNV